jgi:hypothetical protein
MSNTPEICRGCYRWNQWQHRCSYFWDKKKECGSKVRDYEDMVNLDQLRRR